MVVAVMCALLVSACTTWPTGPSIMAMPGSTKSFDQFRADDVDCRGYAFDQIGGTTANKAATDSAVSSAAIGTVIGTLAGAAIGGRGGAGVGAAGGLVVGSAVGSSNAHAAGYTTQQRYDNAYVQCMYARGQKVPVTGQLAERAPVPLAPRSANIPPPPPGNPPPPPPGVR